MQQYIDLVTKIMKEGKARDDRTGTGTIGIFGHQMRFDLTKGFPLVTTKKTWIEGVIREMLWMIRGQTNIRHLTDHGVHIWDEWAAANGDLGPVYGAQWRRWQRDPGAKPIDQLQELIDNLKRDPYSRRHVVTAWNPADLPLPGVAPEDNPYYQRMALAPCHCLMQFYVEDMTLEQRGDYYEAEIGESWKRDMIDQGWAPGDEAAFYDHQGVPSKALSCQLYQRSCDVFLGLPFNIAGYALLTHMIAKMLGYDVGDFVWSGGDVHLYQDHLQQARVLLQRSPRALPVLQIKRTPARIEDFVFEDFKIIGYHPHDAIKAPVSK